MICLSKARLDILSFKSFTNLECLPGCSGSAAFDKLECELEREGTSEAISLQGFVCRREKHAYRPTGNLTDPSWKEF